jgi:hypothetical protein
MSTLFPVRGRCAMADLQWCVFICAHIRESISSNRSAYNYSFYSARPGALFAKYAMISIQFLVIVYVGVCFGAV